MKIIPNKAAKSQRRATPACLLGSARASGVSMGDKGSLRSHPASVSLRQLELKVACSPSHSHKDCSLLPLAYGSVGKAQGRPGLGSRG